MGTQNKDFGLASAIQQLNHYLANKFRETPGKISDICLKQRQGMRGRAAPPHPGIYRVPPPPRGGNHFVRYPLDSVIYLSEKLGPEA